MQVHQWCSDHILSYVCTHDMSQLNCVVRQKRKKPTYVFGGFQKGRATSGYSGWNRTARGHTWRWRESVMGFHKISTGDRTSLIQLLKNERASFELCRYSRVLRIQQFLSISNAQRVWWREKLKKLVSQLYVFFVIVIQRVRINCLN